MLYLLIMAQPTKRYFKKCLNEFLIFVLSAMVDLQVENGELKWWKWQSRSITILEQHCVRCVCVYVFFYQCCEILEFLRSRRWFENQPRTGSSITPPYLSWYFNWSLVKLFIPETKSSENPMCLNWHYGILDQRV